MGNEVWPKTFWKTEENRICWCDCTSDQVQGNRPPTKSYLAHQQSVLGSCMSVSRRFWGRFFDNLRLENFELANKSIFVTVWNWAGIANLDIAKTTPSSVLLIPLFGYNMISSAGPVEKEIKSSRPVDEVKIVSKDRTFVIRQNFWDSFFHFCVLPFQYRPAHVFSQKFQKQTSGTHTFLPYARCPFLHCTSAAMESLIAALDEKLVGRGALRKLIGFHSKACSLDLRMLIIFYILTSSGHISSATKTVTGTWKHVCMIVHATCLNVLRFRKIILMQCLSHLHRVAPRSRRSATVLQYTSKNSWKSFCLLKIE